MSVVLDEAQMPHGHKRTHYTENLNKLPTAEILLIEETASEIVV
jgi:hypothetical protein